jgi:hypothetical protein
VSEALLLAATALTSLIAIAALRLRGVHGFVTALTVLLETVGATVLLLFANLLVAAVIVLLARRVWYYASLYEAADIAFVVLSLLQAIVITAWSRLR